MKRKYLRPMSKTKPQQHFEFSGITARIKELLQLLQLLLTLKSRYIRVHKPSVAVQKYARAKLSLFVNRPFVKKSDRPYNFSHKLNRYNHLFTVVHFINQIYLQLCCRSSERLPDSLQFLQAKLLCQHRINFS